VAQSCIRWYDGLLRNILPFSKNDNVELNLVHYLKQEQEEETTTTATTTRNPFLFLLDDNIHNNKPSPQWMPARIVEIDLVKMMYILLPDVPWKLMMSMETTTLTPFCVRFDEIDVLLQPAFTNLPDWRNLDYIKNIQNIQNTQNTQNTQNIKNITKKNTIRRNLIINETDEDTEIEEGGMMMLHFCQDIENHPDWWTPVSVLWDFKDISDEEHILVGYDTELSRDAQWVSVLSENIYIGNPYSRLILWDSIAKQKLLVSREYAPASISVSQLDGNIISSLTYNNTSFNPITQRVFRDRRDRYDISSLSSSATATATSTTPTPTPVRTTTTGTTTLPVTTTPSLSSLSPPFPMTTSISSSLDTNSIRFGSFRSSPLFGGDNNSFDSMSLLTTPLLPPLNITNNIPNVSRRRFLYPQNQLFPPPSLATSATSATSSTSPAISSVQRSLFSLASSEEVAREDDENRMVLAEIIPTNNNSIEMSALSVSLSEESSVSTTTTSEDEEDDDDDFDEEEEEKEEEIMFRPLRHLPAYVEEDIQDNEDEDEEDD